MSGKSQISTQTIEEKLSGRFPGITKKRCMYRVHEQLREVTKKAYEPVLLAIGPYNDQDKVGQGFMKEHKLRYLQQMDDWKRRECIKVLKDLEERARKCYAECFNQITSDDFVEMMLLDGCFIIELFRKYQKRDEDGPIISTDQQSPEYEAKDQTDAGHDPINRTEQPPKYDVQDPTDGGDQITGSEESELEYDPIFRMAWVLPRIARDLLLFENQLPYFVLDKLFEIMSTSNEGSTSVGHISTGSLDELALKFFIDFLPFEWDFNASRSNSTGTIRKLEDLAHAAPTLSLQELIWARIEFGSRFKKAQFEHLLGLIHASISISILDTEIKRQGAGVKLEINTSKENPSANESQSEDRKSDEIGSWSITKDFDIELQGAGIELNKVNTFINLLRDPNRTENQKSKWCESGTQGDGVESKTTEKFKRLLCLNKNEKWNSIPHGKELRKAGVEFKNAKKFQRLLALRDIEHRNIRGATELAEAGIKFEKAEEDDRFSIKFDNGRMEISPMRIGDSTETYLRNLIAYEQYCDKKDRFNYVTNYVYFMDSLINTPKDVELLRRRGIILNYLGDDAVTCSMVNKLCDNIQISTRSSIYARTSMDVNRYCEKNWNLWIAILRHKYFNTPWAWISVLAAVFLLLLAIVQTVFSILP